MKNNKIKSVTILFTSVLLAASSVNAGMRATGAKKNSDVKVYDLELYPAKQADSQNLRLLPDPNDMNDNAVDLYNKALNALPNKADKNQLDSLLQMQIKDFPVNKAESILKKHQEAIKLAAKAGRCKQCNWPDTNLNNLPMESLSKYKTRAMTIALQARMQMAQDRYDQALDTLQTGMKMSRNLGQAPTIIEGLVGISVGGVMCSEIRDFIQQPDAPSLYAALDNLPQPFIDLDIPIKAETENAKKLYKNSIIQNTMLNQLKPAHDKVRLVAQRLSRDIALLKCVEAIRLYASSHSGKFPSSLADITEVPIPDDPLTGKPFAYKVIGSKATLESMPSEEIKIQFNLTLNKHK